MPYTNPGKTWKSVANQIREKIASGEYRPGSKLPTEAEIIDEMGVSKMTVHRAFRELASEGVVDRVERVGTFVSQTAVPTTKRIGLFLPTTEGFLEVRILSGIRDALDPKREIVLYATDNDPVVEAEMLNRADGEVDGILIFPTCHPRVSQRLERLHEGGCPVICVDREASNVRLPSVTSDNYGATRQALDHLFTSGHRRIAFFGFYSNQESPMMDRHRAYVDFVKEMGLGDPDETTRLVEPRNSEELPLELRLLKDAMLYLTSGPKPITAAFCANEHYFHVLVELAQQMPRELLKRFEFATFCDWPLLGYPGIRFHQIRQDAKGVGRAAGLLMERALAGEEVPRERQEIPASLHVSDRPGGAGPRLPSSTDVRRSALGGFPERP
jgi:GntR family transcriptional regulator of arabinose operon